MSWQDEAVPLLRGVFGDIGTSVEYVDNRLEEVLIFAAHFVANDFNFTNTYEVTINTGIITPDPTSGTKDVNFINLMVLKASQLLTSYEWRAYSLRAYTVKDGPSSIDGRAVAEEKRKIAEVAKKIYDIASMTYRSGKAVSIAAIVTPANFDYYGPNDSVRYY